MKKFLLDASTFDYIVGVLGQCTRASSFELSEDLFDFDTDDARLSLMEEIPAIFSNVTRDADKTLSAHFITALGTDMNGKAQEQVTGKITIGSITKFGIPEVYCLKTLNEKLSGVSLVWVAEDVVDIEDEQNVNNGAQTN